MENWGLWVSVFVGIVMPIVGWLINTVVTKKIEDIIETQKEDKATLFMRIDEIREDYVRKDLYEQEMKHLSEHNTNVEKKLESIDTKMNELKNLFINKLNGK